MARSRGHWKCTLVRRRKSNTIKLWMRRKGISSVEEEICQLVANECNGISTNQQQQWFQILLDLWNVQVGFGCENATSHSFCSRSMQEKGYHNYGMTLCLRINRCSSTSYSGWLHACWKHVTTNFQSSEKKTWNPAPIWSFFRCESQVFVDNNASKASDRKP